MTAREPSVKDKLRQFFLEHQGEIVSSKQLQELVAPRTEWARRVRELRDEERWPILTDKDRSSLKPGQYMLDGSPPEKKDIRIRREISQRLRAQALDRNGFTCQMCGITPGDIDEITGRKARLHVGHIVDKSLGGKDELSNLRTLCSTCNQGAKNVTSEKPSSHWLLSQIRRAGWEEQKAAYEWLSRKFSDQ